MKLTYTTLGSGIPLSSFYRKFDYRNPSGHILSVDNQKIILDSGDGMRAKMETAKIDYYSIEIIFISHFHPDHFALEALIQAYYLRAMRSKRIKQINVYGPKNIENNFREIWNRKHTPTFYDTKLKKWLNLRFREYKHRVRIDIDNIKVTPYKVIHGEMDAYALRFKIDKKIFTYSGDSGVCEAIVQASRNADLFVCEAGINVGDKTGNRNEHLSPRDAGEVAKKAGAKKLVLVHYSGKDDREVMTKEAQSSGYAGKVDVAIDLQTLII